MSRLFDILAFGDSSRFLQMPGTDWEECEKARRLVKTSVLLDASPAWDAWDNWLSSCVGTIGDTLADCIPPWTNTLVSSGNTGSSLISELAVHCVSSTIPDDIDISLIRDRGYDVSSLRPIFTQEWWRMSDGRIAAGNSSLVILDSAGKYTGLRVQLGARGDSNQFWCLAFFAFQLAHCRNVDVIESEYIPRLPRGMRNRKPRIQFRTIGISGSSARGDTGSDGGSGESRTAKHLCRGSFATYSDDNKLFGKYVGTFWRPMCIKGLARNGIVGKDYVLNG